MTPATEALLRKEVKNELRKVRKQKKECEEKSKEKEEIVFDCFQMKSDKEEGFILRKIKKMENIMTTINKIINTLLLYSL